MIITLPQPKTITTQQAVTKTITTLTIERVVDVPSKKIVRAFVSEIPTPL